MEHAIQTANLDSIYNGWGSPTPKPNQTIIFAGSNYTIATSQAGRDVLTNAPNNWIITDSGGI